MMKLSKHKLVEKTLQKNHACYVLITCDKGKESGTYDVEMSYSEDAPDLASFLIDGAKVAIEEDTSDSL